MSTAAGSPPPVLPAEERERIRGLLATRSERELAAALAVSRQTLGRCLAGLPVHPGTVLLIRERLRSLADAIVPVP